MSVAELSINGVAHCVTTTMTNLVSPLGRWLEQDIAILGFRPFRTIHNSQIAKLNLKCYICCDNTSKNSILHDSMHTERKNKFSSDARVSNITHRNMQNLAKAPSIIHKNKDPFIYCKMLIHLRHLRQRLCSCSIGYPSITILTLRQSS
jgi:hypothetical protein